MSLDTVIFLVSAVVAVFGATMMIAQRNPVMSVLYLILSLLAQAVLYVQLGALFLGAVLIIVYSGAIMVLFLFVIMLLNVKSEEDTPLRGGRTLRGMALALVTLLVLQAGTVLLRSEPGPAPAFDASTRKMAEILFSPHFLYVFEATSILILAALVGAVALAKKEL